MDTPTNISISTLLQSAREHVARQCLAYQDSRLVLHTNAFANHLATLVAQLAEAEDIAPDEQTVAQLAALFYPLGFRMDYDNGLNASRRAVRSFLSELGQEDWAGPVDTCLAVVNQSSTDNIAAQILQDSLVCRFCNSPTEQWGNLYQLERSLLQGTTDRLTAAQQRLAELLQIRYATTAGQRYWQLTVAQHLHEEQRRIEKWQRDQNSTPSEADAPAPFASLESGPPVRAAQTFFRAVYRNHINLSAIADNKANIMISVNSILISVLITFLSYRNIAETQPMILVPVIVFLVTGLASLVFAVLAARPKVTQLSSEEVEPTRGLAFFGNFVQLSEEAYKTAMDKAFNNGSILYGNMTEDLYHLGKVLDKKYRFLSISYNIFMAGLIITVGLFLITIFI